MLPCTRGYAASPRGLDSQLPIADCHRAIHKSAAILTNSLITIYKIYREWMLMDYVGMTTGSAVFHWAD